MKINILLLHIFLLISYSGHAQQRQIEGRVFLKGSTQPIEGATIALTRHNEKTLTDQNGYFKILTPKQVVNLVISHTGFRSVEITLDTTKNDLITIELIADKNVLEEVTVSTGYQTLPKERATGSFSVVNNELLNRSVSTDIISRLENTVPGLLFNKGDAAGTDPLLIRGRNTIHADASPLIVLDDFPYDGDVNNINPNDIESVTILKDAAAASIWGARAGNGIIVITTKKGKAGKAAVQFNSNLTVQARPDLYNIRQISPADAIELEKELYGRGTFQSAFTGPYYNIPVTPVVELLASGDSDALAKIEQMKRYDVRDDIARYLYRNSVNQQYNLSISGAAEKLNYLVSAGYDNNRLPLTGNQQERFSFRSGNTFHISDRLRADASIAFTQTTDRQGENRGYNTGRAKAYYPYARLADDDGMPLPLYLDYRKGYVDTVGAGSLLDWNYSPINEVSNVENKAGRKDILLKSGLSYRLIDGLNATVRYQYQNQMIENRMLYSENSFFTRDLINQYAQYNSAQSSYTFPLPKGGIADDDRSGVISHQGRIQLDYTARFGTDHELNALAGYEIRNRISTDQRGRIYGYEPEYEISNTLIDFVTRYKLLPSSSTARIPGRQSSGKYVDNFMSYYMNFSYSYLNRYTFSGSFRKDEANLFGVEANQKGTPLWSIGGAWDISREGFLTQSPIQQLVIRATYGVNGNISRLASAHTTAIFGSSFVTGLRSASVISLPNKNLKWEEVKTFNLGLDLKLKREKLYANVDVYRKDGKGLLARAPIDPTFGSDFFYGNVAETKGRGADLVLGSRVLDRSVSWNTDLIYSYAEQQVAKYLMPVSTSPVPYLSEKAINPILDRPLYSVYSFRWNGLDGDNGDPVGYFEGAPSKDYSAIYNRSPLDSLVFHGPLQPTHFGVWRNTLNYKRLSVSFSISYRFGGYFRQPSVSYGQYPVRWTDHADYTNRWQAAGDENNTHIPSNDFGQGINRGSFYLNSEVLVHTSDVIRFEDVQFSYQLPLGALSNVVHSAKVYGFLSNLGMIWKANDANIDPYFNNVPKDRLRFSFGISLTL